MSLAFKRIKVYTKVTLLVIVALAIATVFIKNRGHRVQFWFFGLVDDQTPVNVVWLIVCTAIASVLSWWVLLAAISMVKDVREVRRQEEQQERERAQQAMARKLREQEQRIDEKLSKAIGKDANSGV
ncbi:MAG TPA: hypothetical protein VM243_03340 [Phycisphaerae bacterium]|nr:hypothetical protein [Phycisphaerae bacterium]